MTPKTVQIKCCWRKYYSFVKLYKPWSMICEMAFLNYRPDHRPERLGTSKLLCFLPVVVCFNAHCFSQHVYISSLLFLRRTTPQRITQLLMSQRSSSPRALPLSPKSTCSVIRAAPSFPEPAWTAVLHLAGTSPWIQTGPGSSPVNTPQSR